MNPRTIDSTQPGQERLGWIALALWLAAGALGTYVRVAGVSEQVLHGDEEHALGAIESGYRAILTTFDGHGSHIGFSLLQRVALDVFGSCIGAYRVPAILAGVLAPWLVLPLGKRFVGLGPAWLASLLLAVHPLHVYYSRTARPYGAAFLLLLVLLAVLHDAFCGRRKSWILVALVAGVLPWFHLTAVGPVLLLGLASLVWTRRGPARECLAAFAGAALLCCLLYLPAASGVRAYVHDLAHGRGRFSPHWPETVTLLGGTLAGGAWFVGGGLLGALVLLKRDTREGLVLLAASLAPPLVLLLLQPRGSHFAAARYLLIGLGPLLLASSFLLFRLLRSRRALAYFLGAGFVAFQLACGPSLLEGLHGAHAGQLDPLLSARRFEQPFARTPALYRELARAPRTLTVVEYPSSPWVSLCLHNYELQHRQRVWVGLDQDARGLRAHAPYIDLSAMGELRARTDWLIVHHDLQAELDAYFDSIAFPRVSLGKVDLGGSEQALLALLGPASFRDEFVWAWHFEHP